MRLGIVASHPVQYQVPWYRALTTEPEVDLTVYYALIPTPEQQGVVDGQDAGQGANLGRLDRVNLHQIGNQIAMRQHHALGKARRTG